jgi:pilus assembly protein CpaC
MTRVLSAIIVTSLIALIGSAQETSAPSNPPTDPTSASPSDIPTTLPPKEPIVTSDEPANPSTLPTPVAAPLEAAGDDDDRLRATYNLNLIIGLPQDLELPFLPRDVTFLGDWKKITSAQRIKGAAIVRFNAKRIGTPRVGTMVILDRNKRKLYEIIIKVDKSTLVKAAQEIKGLLNDIEGITVNIVGSRVIIDGQVLLPKEIDRIELVVSQFKDQASSLVTLSPVAEKKIAEVIEREINNPEITVRAVNKNFVIEGQAENEDERKRAILIAKTYVPDFVPLAGGKVSERKNHQIVDLLTLRPVPEKEPRKLIQVVVHFVELKKNYNKNFRIQWMPDLGDDSAVTFSYSTQQQGGTGTTITGTIRNLIPKLNWAKAADFGRILLSETLMVQEGERGSVESSNTYLVPVVQQGGLITNQPEKAGITLAVTPAIVGQRSDAVEMDMSFNVAAFLGSVGGVPIINSRNITTKLTVRSGQSAAVAGLISSNGSTGYNQLPPGASNNPIISIYASKDFQRGQTQFVTFVTPVIRATASEGVDRVKKKFRLKD